jgi:hypothetical protein
MLRVVSCAALLLLVANIANADVESGPKVGEKIAALKVHAVTGDNSGTEFDYAAERKEKPTIYIFVQADQFSRPIARYMKVLDGAVNKVGSDARIVAVWLTDDAEKSKEYLPKAQQSINLEATSLTVSGGPKSGPDGWGINDRAFVTTVVAKDAKTAATFAYVSVNDTDVRAVVAALKKAIDAKDKDSKKE